MLHIRGSEKGETMEKTILTAVIVAAMSFVLQKTLNNFIYGIVILVTRPFKKGDKISVRQNGREIASGKVIRRGILHVRIKDYNRDVCIIPNSVMEGCTIVNSDYKTGVNYNNRIKISFDSDIDEAKRIIKDIVLSHEETFNTEDNTYLICKAESDGLAIDYNVRTVDVNTSFDVCGEITESIVKEFQKRDNIELK